MVALPQPFDATAFDPTSAYEPLPDGWYQVIITASEVKPTSKNTGMQLVLERKVLDCPHDRSLIGRTFIERLNVQNPSAQATEIANRALSAICHVTGVYRVSDTAQLHNIPHRVRTTISLNDKQVAVGNNVVEYADQHGNPPAKNGAGPGATQSAMAQPQQPQYQPPQTAQPQPQTAAQAPAGQGWAGTATQAAPQPQPAQPPQAQPQPGTAGAPTTTAWGAPGGAPAAPNGQAAPAGPQWGAPAR